MKLLFDQNISFRIVKKILDKFPGSKQVRELGLENMTDKQIWDFAKENEFSIVTFDSDFYELANYYGHPPKIIWLRFGNRRTDYLAESISAKADLIVEFLSNVAYAEIACIELDLSSAL